MSFNSSFKCNSNGITIVSWETASTVCDVDGCGGGEEEEVVVALIIEAHSAFNLFFCFSCC